MLTANRKGCLPSDFTLQLLNLRQGAGLSRSQAGDTVTVGSTLTRRPHKVNVTALRGSLTKIYTHQEPQSQVGSQFSFPRPRAQEHASAALLPSKTSLGNSHQLPCDKCDATTQWQTRGTEVIL